MNNRSAPVRLELGDRSYDIHIGEDVLGHLGRHCSEAGLSGNAALVSSPPVSALYGETAEMSLRDAGFEVFTFSLPDVP